MLRNTYCCVRLVSSKRYFHLDRELFASSRKFNSVLRQGKIMAKLSGERIAGNKKHWFPSHSDLENRQHRSTINSNVLFQGQNIGRLEEESDNRLNGSTSGGSGSGGRRINSRRMNVLNKLFMEQISGLLATGEISEHILGKGLQITRVRISHDFHQLSVYWTTTTTNPNSGISSTLANNLLEKELQKCSGLLRHELSQLCLMGRVPRITFVKDIFQANLLMVDELLRDLNLGGNKPTDDIQVKPNDEEYINNSLPTLKEYFFGINETVTTTTTKSNDRDSETIRGLETKIADDVPPPPHPLPPMRHDVFGLDHKGIMLKVLGKMRKSKQAWERYNEELQTTLTGKEKPHQQKEESSSVKAERFQAYLDQCRKTESSAAFPNRKKLRRTATVMHHHNLNDVGGGGAEDEPYFMSRQQREMYEAEDDFGEDEEYDKENKNNGLETRRNRKKIKNR